MLTVPPMERGVVPEGSSGRGGGYATGDGPHVVALRGGAGLARANSLAAFDRSFVLGVRYLETDVRVTADGECVAVRDATLARVTGADRRIEDLTLSGIRRLGIGGDRVLRIADLVQTFDSAKFLLDLKDAAALEPLLAVLRSHDALERVCLAGTRDRWLDDARRLAGPRLATALGWDAATRLVLAARAGRRPAALPAARFVHLPGRLGRTRVLTERVVGLAQDLGLGVLAWNVEDRSAMHAMLDLGVNGLITARPDVAREVLLERGAWQAPQAWPMLGPASVPRPALFGFGEGLPAPARIGMALPISARIGGAQARLRRRANA